MKWSSIFPLALALLLLTGCSFGQDSGSWVGQKVVMKGQTLLQVDGQAVKQSERLHLYTVDRAEGDKL